MAPIFCLLILPGCNFLHVFVSLSLSLSPPFMLYIFLFIIPSQEVNNKCGVDLVAHWQRCGGSFGGGHYSTNKTLHFYLDLFLFLSNIYKVGTPVPVGTYSKQMPVKSLLGLGIRTICRWWWWDKMSTHRMSQDSQLKYTHTTLHFVTKEINYCYKCGIVILGW